MTTKTSRPKPKEINTQKIIQVLPRLDEITLTCRTPPLEGATFKVNWDGSWSTHVAEHLDLDEVHGDLSLSSDLGSITLKKAIGTSYDSSSGHMGGVAVEIELNKHIASPGAMLYRSYVKTDPNLLNKITFPERILDPEAHVLTSALLPLKGDWGNLDIYFIRQARTANISPPTFFRRAKDLLLSILRKQSPTMFHAEDSFVILESDDCSGFLEFKRRCGAAKQLLTYLTAQRLDRPSCDILLSKSTGSLIEAHWHAGRDHKDNIYAAIPCQWAEWVSAKNSLKLPHSASPLPPKVISTCFSKLLSEPGLAVPIEYITTFPSAPVEMRGALLSVALESLTDLMQDRGLLKTVKPLSDEKWKLLRAELASVMNSHSKSWSKDQIQIFSNRISNLNSPTNQDKLSQPFKLLNIPISEEELDAIAKRNKFLHEGRILDHTDREANPEAWKTAYAVEMRLFSAINKLLLKYLGYEGPIIDWGARGLKPTGSFIML